MNRKSKSPYLIMKRKNLHSIYVNSSFLNKKSQKGKKFAEHKDESHNRSTSFQTVKKINLSKLKKKTPFHSRINSERSNLNSTIKKKKVQVAKSLPKRPKNVFLYHRSDFQPKQRSFSTPKFGDQFIKAQNLTYSRIGLLVELQSIRKEFTQNLNQISLTCLKRLNPLQQNLKKCLAMNSELLEREWFLIRKSCINVKNEKENQVVEKMIWEWENKRLKINQIERNLQKALQVLLL